MIKCDPRAKANCPFKNPCCVDEEAYFLEGSDCYKFNQEVLSPPPTHADRIRAMSDDDMAKWLADAFDCHNCSEHERLGDNPLLSDEQCDQECEKHFLDWLKQPYEEGDPPCWS